ncbi:hypothetical protein BpHYR1_039077 [Brachionus plicatilis]|uniref:Uncharacterized protein n=1 Tax=Brachionus plicatilis TaxID=10195 RepID=A0A3M7RZQ4_BRAPC|nr:hypothetical protein BpHYR1_039077 [Brachionus plicatilis]
MCLKIFKLPCKWRLSMVLMFGWRQKGHSNIFKKDFEIILSKVEEEFVPKRVRLPINPSNYRPISITSCLGKLLERKGNIENKINKHLKELEEWLFRWKMKISVENSFYMKEVKFLGVKFDSGLIFTPMVDEIKERCTVHSRYNDSLYYEYRVTANDSIDNNQLEFEKLGSVLTNKIVNFDKYVFRHCDDLVPSGETYSDDLVAFEQGEQTEEAEPSLTTETETEFISKEKAIAGLNTAREYFMNSKEDYYNWFDLFLYSMLQRSTIYKKFN